MLVCFWAERDEVGMALWSPVYMIVVIVVQDLPTLDSPRPQTLLSPDPGPP